MRTRLALISVVALAGALAFLAAPSHAQGSSCAPDDLKCRVAALEARLSALEGKQSKIEVRQNAVEAAGDGPSNVLKTYTICRSTCQQEANDLCASKGFASGRAKTFERPKVGPVILKAAECTAR